MYTSGTEPDPDISRKGAGGVGHSRKMNSHLARGSIEKRVGQSAPSHILMIGFDGSMRAFSVNMQRIISGKGQRD